MFMMLIEIAKADDRVAEGVVDNY